MTTDELKSLILRRADIAAELESADEQIATGRAALRTEYDALGLGEAPPIKKKTAPRGSVESAVRAFLFTDPDANAEQIANKTNLNPGSVRSALRTIKQKDEKASAA
jgi:hypothetical protein